MKNRYQRMTREEKRNCQKQYYETSKGKEMHIRFARLILTGIIGILFSIYIIVNSYIEKNLDWLMWVISGVLLVSSIIFIVGSLQIKKKCLNEFAIKNFK